MKPAAIVVTYNSEREVGACLEALLEAGLDVFVVDNASSDDTAELVAGHFPRAQLIVNRENRGFARAANQALACTTTELVLLVNPDCVVPRRTVGGLVEYMTLHRDVGVAGPRLRDARGEVAVSAHPFESVSTVVASRFGGSLTPVSVRRLLSRSRRRQSYDVCRRGSEPATIDWVSGACMAVRKSLLDRLGGLDSSYFMYYEDEELCLRAWDVGAKVVYLPAFEAHHSGGASSSDPALVWPQLYRSMLRFHARHRPRTYLLVRAVILVRALLGVVLASIRTALALGGAGPRRALAWARIARIAASSSRAALR